MENLMIKFYFRRNDCGNFIIMKLNIKKIKFHCKHLVMHYFKRNKIIALIYIYIYIYIS